jgi:heme exporter protein C
MRQATILTVGLAAALLLVRNIYHIFLVMPDEVNQGAIWRIFYFHFPVAITSFLLFYIGAGASIGFLWKKSQRADQIAAVANEIGLALALITLITGMIWARIAWGIWWTWDHRLTSYLICILLYSGYIMLRGAVDEPTQRGRLSAVLSIFASLNIMLVWKSIEWFRTQHPGPVLSIRNGGGMAPGMEELAYWNVLALGLFVVVIFMIRLRQEEMQSEIESLRRFAHAL